MLYTNIALMLADIAAFIRMTGKTVLCCDSPLEGLYGYISEDRTQTWEVHFLRVDDIRTISIGPVRQLQLQCLHEMAVQGVITDPDFKQSLIERYRNLPEKHVNGKIRIELPGYDLRD